MKNARLIVPRKVLFGIFGYGVIIILLWVGIQNSNLYFGTAKVPLDGGTTTQINTVQAAILGAIQGLTEFLPISSSGHLVLFQQFFGIHEAQLFFDICLHMGTLIAVIVFFRREIFFLAASAIRFLFLCLEREITLKKVNDDGDMKLALLIVVGSLPTVVMGLVIKEWVDQIFSSVFLVGWMLLVTGFLLWATRWLEREGRGISGFSIPMALLIGFVQGMAILPGISRSGSTIAVALFLGLNRHTAAQYSFLLSIPAIVGALLLSIWDLSITATFTLPVLIGSATACLIGYLALRFLIYMVNKGRMHLFAPYCWLLGATALLV
ncbi:MAG: undecaprenyl-diphosphate phosphatase [Thermodesulfobacteriota bacterium]